MIKTYLAAAALSLTLTLPLFAQNEDDSSPKETPALVAPPVKVSTPPPAKPSPLPKPSALSKTAAPAKTAPASVPAEAAPADAAPAGAVFSGAWKDATADEKAAFLEASPELRAKAQEKWAKTPAKQRKLLLKNHPLLANRPLKQKWEEATPEERVAFLGADPSLRQRVRENWDLLTPEQRLQMVQKRPSIARRALHHAWADATPEEQTAFLESQPDLRRGLGKLWSQPGATPEDRAAFVDRAWKTLDAARERWQKAAPALRAQLVSRWSGWKLKPMAAPRPAKTAKPLKKARP